jgi:hypothetical protein
MRMGDLIEWSGKRWLVRKLERETKTAIIVDADRVSDVIPNDLEKAKPEECKVICNPSDQWPYVAVAQKPKSGALRVIARPDMTSTTATVLRLFYDWVMADTSQPGGAIFFNPDLGLRHGDVLLATYQKGALRITIPREFLSTQERIARATSPREVPRRSFYDRLKQNVYDDDE